MTVTLERGEETRWAPRILWMPNLPPKGNYGSVPQRVGSHREHGRLAELRDGDRNLGRLKGLNVWDRVPEVVTQEKNYENLWRASLKPMLYGHKVWNPSRLGTLQISEPVFFLQDKPPGLCICRKTPCLADFCSWGSGKILAHKWLVLYLVGKKGELTEFRKIANAQAKPCKPAGHVSKWNKTQSPASFRKGEAVRLESMRHGALPILLEAWSSANSLFWFLA